jgi:pimeloyl-ACP methyl ester carboxylesterase
MLSEWAFPGRKRNIDRTALLNQLREAKVGCAELEELIQLGPPLTENNPFQPGKLYEGVPLSCFHLNYRTHFLLYLPSNYQASQRWPLMLIGHGGNSRMPGVQAKMAAMGGLRVWLHLAEKHGYILAAPLTERGWAGIGYSVIFSLLSRLQRTLSIDADRIYVTGHSMGGHLAWRSALLLGDRWAAVSPMSGGYDYVAKGQMPQLSSVPGYATFGSREPYGIDMANRKMQAWLARHPLDWQVVEKKGGHEIFMDELPRIMDFFNARQRHLHVPEILVQGARAMSWRVPDQGYAKEHTWYKDRPIPMGINRWLRLFDHPGLQKGSLQRLQGKIDAETNTIQLQSQHVPRFRLYFHPQLLDFKRPVRVLENEALRYEGMVKQDPGLMLDLLRELDDWGRTYWAAMDFESDSLR